MKVHQAIAQALLDAGADTMFGLMGDANLFFVNSYVERGGRYVSSANESGATLMALGYAQASGGLGLVTTTYGPALSNTVTALIDGVKATRPLLLICGDTAPEDLGNLQDIHQRDLVIATGAGYETARSVETVVADLMVARRRAILERKPVVFSVPIRFMWQDVEYRPISARLPERQGWMPQSSDLDDAVGIIAAARAPIILAGRGATSPQARAALIRLAERTGGLLATTLIARGLFAGEDHNLGIMGNLATPVALDAIVESDCIVAFGATLTKYTADKGALLKGKRIVQCNIEAGDIGRYYPVDAAVVGDPGRIAEAIVDLLDMAEIPASGFRNDERNQQLKAYTLAGEPHVDQSTATTLDVRKALVALDAALPQERVVVVDGGRFMIEGYKAIGVPDPGSFVFTSNVGSIGLGTSYAIGASFAAKGRPVVLIAGDGGFMLGGLAEFNTAVRHKVDLIILLCNDNAYGAEHIQFRERQMDPGLSMFQWPDFASVAQALGGSGITVRTEADLATLPERIAARTSPLLIDIRLDPDRMPDRPH